MKLKTIAAVVGATVYAAATAQAVASASQSQYSVKPIELSADVIKARMEKDESLSFSNMLEGNGVNVRLAPKAKFVEEPGITGNHRYIIRFKGAPAALYEGDGSGKGATKSLFANNKMGIRTTNLKSDPAVVAYTNSLKTKQQSFVSKASQAGVSLKVEQDFQIALNGITAELTQQQAAKLAKMPEVAFISREVNNELLMNVAPERTGTPNAWADSSFTQAPDGLKGEGMLVGVIDTGINSQHPSFATTGDDGYTVQNPLGTGNYLHDCTVTGQESLCNDKLIGIWSTPLITDAYSDPDFAETRPANGQDYNGHGSHTASIAAGNVLNDVPYLVAAIETTGDGLDTGYTIPQISGIAPHANIITYQVCYPGSAAPDKWVGCPQAATVAAVEQAILDGVDVINYSISGGYDPHNDPVELAFLAAHEAGINVAASAGNSGAYQTVQHVSPWVSSVASSQHGRTFNLDANNQMKNLSGGDTAIPASYRTDVQGILTSDITGPMVLAENLGDALCENAFAAGTFTNGEIVFCERGNIPLVDKASNVAAGGAAAVVIYNSSTSEQTIYTNIRFAIPGVMMDKYDGPAMATWLRTGTGHMGTLPMTTVSENTNSGLVDAISSFSSIGHAYLAEYREATAPSITAPGSNIYSAYTQDKPFTAYTTPTKFATLSGTSMSSPHVAGLLTLIKQAHPEWTPSEVMSAIQLTANDAVGDKFGRTGDDYINPWFYGSGIAQVDRAVHSGLIMNVPVENYSETNPYQGGNIGALNTPNMIDSACYRSCSWVREVTATVDGSWTVTPETSEYSVKLDVQPSTFTLQAGETQRLIITGSWLDSRNVYQSARGLTVFGKVKMTHEDPTVPVAQMGVEMQLDSGKLPEVVDFEAHSTESTHQISNLSLGEAPAIVATAYQPVQANIEEVELVERHKGYGSLLFEVAQDLDKVHVSWVNVPQGAKRLVAEVLESGAAINPNDYTDPKGNAGIYVGIDYNDDGVIDYDSEAICKSSVSSYELKDWCNIPNPEAGNYWVVWQEHNYNRKNYLGFEDAIFKHKVATAVVLDEVAQSVTIDTPDSSHDGDLSSITMHLNDASLVNGDKIYSAIELGTDANNPDNIGLISTNIKRGVDEISMPAVQTGARVGDVIDYTVKLMANTSGSDRGYSVTAEIPDGLELVDASLADNRYVAGEVVIDGNQFTVTGSQLDSRDRQRHYIISNSLEDASCKTPVGDGSYVNLYDYGITPLENAPSSNRDSALQLTYNDIYRDARSTDESYALFDYMGKGSVMETGSLFMWGNGMVDLHGYAPGFFGAYQNMAFNDNYKAPAFANMGVFWYGVAGFAAGGLEFGAPYADTGVETEASGISMVRLVDQNQTGTHVIIEWDNLQHLEGVNCNFRGCESYGPNPNSSTSVDAELILARDYDSAPGAFEMVYAYDNLNFGNYEGNGSPFQADMTVEKIATAGVHGGASPWVGAPLDGYINQSAIAGYDGFGGLSDYLQNGMAICFDYDGPEVTAIDVHFSVKVSPEAIGQQFMINVNADVDGRESKVMNAMLKVPSNITLFDIDDQVMDEEGTISGIQVAYMDNNNVSNTITVTGEGVTAVVNGNSNGSTFDLVGDKDFSGTTEVTVTVADDNQPTDAASTSFMVTVNPVNDAPLAAVATSAITITEGDTVTLDGSPSSDPDGDQLTYSWAGDGSIADAAAATTQVSGLTEGEYTFTLTVSDGTLSASTEVTVTVNKPASSGGGGSVGILLLLIAGISGLRRRK